MLDPTTLERLIAALVQNAGGWLRNPVRIRSVTCEVCTTPTESGYIKCFPCKLHCEAARVADQVAPLTYAIAQTQSGYVMRGYKATPPVHEHKKYVTLLSILGLSIHARCAGNLLGAPITHWSLVPSLPPKPGDHPLRALVANSAPGTETILTAARHTQFPRNMGADHFTVSTGPIIQGSHVLLIDDTWAGGGHAQSAALALRAAGASFVSVMVVARWLRPEYAQNSQFIKERLTLDYDPYVCPWTGGGCP